MLYGSFVKRLSHVTTVFHGFFQVTMWTVQTSE